MNYKLKKVDLCGSTIIKPGEERDFVVELEEENRSAIHGVVKFPDGRPVKNALVKLLMKKDNNCDLIPLTFAFTDECGQFLFGVDSGKCYVVKVFFYTPENTMPPSPCYDGRGDKNCY